MEIEEIINKLVDKKLQEYPKRREVYGIVRRIVSKKDTLPRSGNRNLFECDFAKAEERVCSYLSWGPGEDAKLKRQVNAALSRIAVEHGRSLGAIKSRINQKELY